MKLTGTKQKYYGRLYPERYGHTVKVLNRVGNSRAYDIQFISDRFKHTINKQFFSKPTTV